MLNKRVIQFFFRYFFMVVFKQVSMDLISTHKSIPIWLIGAKSLRSSLYREFYGRASQTETRTRLRTCYGPWCIFYCAHHFVSAINWIEAFEHQPSTLRWHNALFACFYTTFFRHIWGYCPSISRCFRCCNQRLNLHIKFSILFVLKLLAHLFAILTFFTDAPLVSLSDLILILALAKQCHVTRGQKAPERKSMHPKHPLNPAL